MSVSAAFFAIAMMSDSATGAAAPVETKPPEKLICRRYAETGSLVKTKRVCHTRGDWARIHDGARRNLEELQMPRNGVNGN